MPSKLKSRTIAIVIVSSIIIIAAFGAMVYLLPTVQPKKKTFKNKTFAALDFLPDPGPIIPGLLKATEEEIKEHERNEPKLRPSSKILEKIREKLNRPDFLLENPSYEDIENLTMRQQGNTSHVVVKVFNDDNSPKVEIKVRSDPNSQEKVKITSDTLTRSFKNNNSNIEIHVLKNETVLIANTSPPRVQKSNIPVLGEVQLYDIE